MTTAVQRGAAANLPVAASVGAYGSVLGVLAAQKGIAWYELLIMNLSVFAGSAQFVMVDMWTPPLPIVEIVIAVWVINLRYLLIGASLNPVFQGKSLAHKALMMHFVADENWAVTMAAYRRSGACTGFLFGGGLCLVTVWCLGTLTGHRLGSMVQNPEAFALDFAFVAVFTALAVSLWRGKADMIPWMVAAVLAVAVEKLLPGKWYIVIGGLGGALTAAVSAAPLAEAARQAPDSVGSKSAGDAKGLNDGIT
jgi:4-azaleucine resistance transporter AzlC